MLQIPTPRTIQSPYIPTASHHRRLRPLHCSTAARGDSVSTTNGNQLIQALCKNGELKKAIQMLSHESPNQNTYEILLKSCVDQKSLSDASDVHRNLIDNGFHEDTYLATKLIYAYSELGSVHDARKVFDEITHRTIYIWNAIFRALSVAGYGEEVLVLYRRMIKSRMPSDRFTYTYILKACVAASMEPRFLDYGKEIHAHILRHGYESHVHVMTTLVDVYGKFGCVVYADNVFSSMPVKNSVSWSAMIASLAKNGKAFEALNVFHEMMLLNRDDLLPSSVTMVSVLQACAALCALKQGKMIHGYILRNDLDSILPVMNVLIIMYARCGDLDSARVVFDRMEKRDIVSWNSMISSYAVHGLGLKAIDVFLEVRRVGLSPTPITFVSVLGACSHSGLVDEGKALFASMVKEHRISPKSEHYACIVDLLGRANRLTEAARFVAEMRDEPGPEVWGSLLGSCRIHCNIELAERASEKLFELEPRNAGNYVLLADIYAEARMWDEVKRVKKLMAAKSLDKVAGCSWIEVGRKMHALKSVDELNPQIEQIHALLVNLSKEMMEEGYVPETKGVLYDLEMEEKQRIVLGHSEKLAVAFGLINCRKGETIRICKNLRLCEDCHSFTKFISKFAGREILVRDVNRFHHFKDGECSCRDYW